MAKIMINKKCRQYNKADAATKKSVNASLERLLDKLIILDKDVNSIFNMDSIVYDRINSELFVYKTHGINNTQLRIVYGVKKEGGELIIYLVDFVNKKSNNKNYINEVNDKFKKTRISDLVFEDTSMAR